MKKLKKFWSFSFKERTTVKSLIIATILYMLIPTIWSIVSIPLQLLLILIPFNGLIFTAAGLFVNWYCTIGLILCFLSFFKVTDNIPKEVEETDAENAEEVAEPAKAE